VKFTSAESFHLVWDDFDENIEGWGDVHEIERKIFEFRELWSVFEVNFVELELKKIFLRCFTFHFVPIFDLSSKNFEKLSKISKIWFFLSLEFFLVIF
jgi:hypothetical protein